MEPVAALPRVLFCRQRGRFPFPLPPRTVGEQKAKVKVFRNRVAFVSISTDYSAIALSFAQEYMRGCERHCVILRSGKASTAFDEDLDEQGNRNDLIASNGQSNSL